MKLRIDQPNALSVSDKTVNNAQAKKPLDNHNEELKKACRDFESVFVSMLFKSMRTTIPQQSSAQSQAEPIYREMLDDEYAKEISKTGSFGIANALYRQLSVTDKKHK